VELDGVKFVAESDLAAIITNPEIIKTDDTFTLKRSGCCG